jgi:hypothetical protein
MGDTAKSEKVPEKPEIKEARSEEPPMKERGTGFVHSGGKPACSSLPRTKLFPKHRDKRGSYDLN